MKKILTVNFTLCKCVLIFHKIMTENREKKTILNKTKIYKMLTIQYKISKRL